MNIRNIAAIVLALSLATACGPSVNLTRDKFAPELPDRQEALQIASSLISDTDRTLVYPFRTESRPVIYGFTPSADLTTVKVTTIAPGDTSWVVSGNVDFPCYDADNTVFKSFTDSLHMVESGGERFLTFGTLRENAGGSEAVVSQLMFNLGTEMLTALSFSGKRLADGRIEGRSNRTMLSNSYRPDVVWAAQLMDSDTTLVVLTDEALRSDQAIEWWLENNPNASRSSKIVFGALPEESTLVETAKNAGKENSSMYRAALFNHRGYTVVVAYRKSGGSWYLAWAEPVCKDKRRDALLNSIYFEKDATLVLYYYKGRTTYKYRLSLANGKLVR